MPETTARLCSIESRLLRVFELWGFSRIITPKLEYEDVLAIGMGEALKGRTYRFDDRQSGRLLAFPPDITPQIARIVATRLDRLPLPHRLCYSGRVLRQTAIQAGQSREIFQTGVELIGLDSPEADAEMIAMAIEAMQGLGIEDFKIDLGQVDFCQGIMQACGLDEMALLQLRESISRKDTSAVADLLALHDVPVASEREIRALPRLFGGREVLDEAAKVVANPRSLAALKNLNQVLEILDIHGISQFLTFDLGETRGFDYHTGITFEGFINGLGESVCSGGRYDNLTSRYGFYSPATGFTFNDLNLLKALERRPESEARTSCDVLLFNARDDRRAALQAARLLRANGCSTARDIINRNYDQSLEYARSMNIRCMLVVGEDDHWYHAVRTRDGVAVPVSVEMIAQPNLMNHIEESRGDT